MIYNYLSEWRSQYQLMEIGGQQPLLTLIFDEAQYVSREAIEMLRYWNDGERTITPFPVGLIFIGNSEFALQEDGSGRSVLSGAVRSRALFVETLEYEDITAADVASFMHSRGSYEPDAISLIVSYFQQRRVRRDLRNMIRLDNVFRRRTGGATVTLDVVKTVLA